MAEENWFRCGRAHFDVDSLDSWAVTPDDPVRHMIPPLANLWPAE